MSDHEFQDGENRALRTIAEQLGIRFPTYRSVTKKLSLMIDTLEMIACEHEDQAEVWGGEEGDEGHCKYHAKWAKIARRALESSR